MESNRRHVLCAASRCAPIPTGVAQSPGAQPGKGHVVPGAVLSMSGPGAAFALAAPPASDVSRITRASGIHGQPVEIVFHDERNRPRRSGPQSHPAHLERQGCRHHRAGNGRQCACGRTHHAAPAYPCCRQRAPSQRLIGNSVFFPGISHRRAMPITSRPSFPIRPSAALEL